MVFELNPSDEEKTREAAEFRAARKAERKAAQEAGRKGTRKTRNVSENPSEMASGYKEPLPRRPAEAHTVVESNFKNQSDDGLQSGFQRNMASDNDSIETPGALQSEASDLSDIMHNSAELFYGSPDSLGRDLAGSSQRDESLASREPKSRPPKGIHVAMDWAQATITDPDTGFIVDRYPAESVNV